ncbi:hypothetical protein ACSBR2_015743 [Camellia fascicularis]
MGEGHYGEGEIQRMAGDAESSSDATAARRDCGDDEWNPEIQARSVRRCLKLCTVVESMWMFWNQHQSNQS